ncbi:MAG: nucleotidyltransferase family protein [Snowella sp.]
MITDSKNIQSSPINTCPEIELLLCCARTQPSPEISQQIQTLVQQTLDWPYLIQTAARHSVLPLLYQNLKTLCPEAVPKPVLSELRNFFHTNAAHNLFLTQELLKILKLFQDNNIPAIPFKGPVLAASVYGNLALRQFGDLDILVNPKDTIKARELLITQDYKLNFDHRWQYSFIHSQKEIYIDLHWELTPFFLFPFKLPDFETLYQRTKPLALSGESVIDFFPDDLLIILAVQVARGGFEGKESLAQICDLAELIRTQQTLDWEKLLKQVRILGLERPFYIGLHLVKTLLNPPLPATVNQAIQQQMQIDPVISIYAVRMQKRLFSEVNSSHIIKTFFRHLMVKAPLSTIPNHIYLLLQFLIVMIRHGITGTNQRDREFLPLPSPSALSFLYYLIRPMRLLIILLKGGQGYF